ncbi:MAG: hypothetical protein DHS20C18_35150 [Saprospiraceae bacterium]|nr:MAG: hypothetical protein DHS20C18_35150 [Saprospiraceae bacterium]
MSGRNTLILFIRNPELGKVKTRLAKTVGDEKALRIYMELLRHTRNITMAVEARRYLFYSHFINQNDNWPNSHFEKMLQAEGDLGTKMSEAFQRVFELRKPVKKAGTAPSTKGIHQKTIIVGSDCASLTTEILHEAFRVLDHSPYVMGPALDGGYYLLGMKKFTPELFQDMPWSTDQVASITQNRIKGLRKSCHLLPELPDIDYAEDWEQHGWEID